MSSEMTSVPANLEPSPAGSPLDRALRVFGDVRAREGRDVLVMFLNVFLLLVAYYILKTVREPLILTRGGAELKAYAAGLQALVLLAYVPAYGWLASRLPRERLVLVVVLFFVACIELFYLAGVAGSSNIGLFFYVWVGIFSLTMIAQFWSFANDLYSKSEGDRLFPLIAVGSTAGAPLGAGIAERLFGMGFSPWILMQFAAVILLVHLGLYLLVHRRGTATGASTGAAPAANAAGGRRGGFGLVLQNRYLRLIAVLMVLLNIVNTTGEFILARLVTAQAAALSAATPGFDASAYIGAFYGSYFFWVNIASVVIQAFLVSRLVKVGGMAGALFALPVVAAGAYGLAATGAGLVLVRWIKTADNATDYSVMNTAKQMLWLPTSREEKYKAKQAIDTFFVRTGDMLAAGVVYIGTNVLALSASGFAGVNLLFVAGSFLVAVLLLRQYREVTARPAAVSQPATAQRAGR